MSSYHQEQVTAIHHWNDSLFSFRTTRDPGFRFANGQFAMIGLMVEGKPLVRAYSMVSPNHEEALEFFSIKVPDGPLTSRLQHIQVGDKVLVGRKPVGTLVHDNLLPGRHLYLLATGTGLAPFLSVIRDLETYERYDKVVLVHGCRRIGDLAYRDLIDDELPADDWFGELARDKLTYYPAVTREPFRNQGRITGLFESGQLSADVGLPAPSLEDDRFMLCGNPDMIADMRLRLTARGMREGNHGQPGHFVIEKAFVEK